MQYNKVKDDDGLVVRNSRRLVWKKIVFALGCIVVFCTTYALILPAITMEVPTYCGFEEHVHTDECYEQITSEDIITPVPVESSPIIHHHTEVCYDELGMLICGEADFVIHSHDENCYDTDGNLWCSLPEISLHIHDESCNIPQEDENEFHIHTDECYELREKLVCGFDTSGTDIFGNEIIGDTAGELTTNTDESVFPAPPVDEFASGEVTTVAETEPALPELGEPVGEPITEPIAEPAVTEPFSEAVQTEATASDIMQSEAVTSAQTGDSGLGEVIPGLSEPVNTDPVHIHTDDCYIYEKVLICEKVESDVSAEPGNYSLDLMAISTENYGLTEKQEDTTDTIGLDESDISDETGYTDLLETYTEPVVSDGLGNPDESSESGELGNSAEASTADESGNEWLEEPNSGSNADICTLSEVILHEHDFSCFDEAGKLVCGMQAVRVHQHTPECDGICYITEEIQIDQTALTCEIPEGEGSHLHSIEYNCFDENMNIICPIEESLGHFHDIHCYGKWEIICGMEEHEHTEECEIDPDDIEIEADGIMMLANEPDTWGYNYDNGGNVSGIYWNRKYELTTVPLSGIQEGSPYILCGPNSTTLMSCENYVYYDNNYLRAIRLSEITNYSAYQYWCFERADGENNYRIYYLDSNGAKNYLYFDGLNLPTQWDGQGTRLLLSPDISKATTFTVTSGNDNTILISGLVEGKTRYINAFWSDGDNTTHWWGHADPCNVKVCTPVPTINEQTAQRLDTITSSNTIINLFDYWTASDDPAGQFMPDDVDNPHQLGINNGHAFHFIKDGDEGVPLNCWCGPNNGPLGNIVENTLGNDGYPRLSATHDGESLAYLFDPRYEHIGKASYMRVGGLLRNDDEGYYFFDSGETMAEYNQDKNEIYIYDAPGVKEDNGTITGQFFPFDQAPEVMEAYRFSPLLNHYFGMTITTRFLQKNSGYTSQSQRVPTSFHFSGDDDVWIFIDDVLVGDCGGIHDACSVDIDFHTGDVRVYNNVSGDGTSTTIKKAFEAAGRADSVKWSEADSDTFADETAHTLKFFYLERGNYSSNLELKYNLIDIPETSIYKVNQYGEVVPGAKFAVYAATPDADGNYQMLSAKGGNVVNEPENPRYDSLTGNMLDEYGNVIANSLYVGTTDSFGEMVFEDTVDHVPLTISELEEKFGGNFILREIEVPDGYRVVSKDAWLEFWHRGAQTILHCVNTTETGSRAAPTLQVTATDWIYLNKDNNPTQQQYFRVATDSATGHATVTPNGTMFAVVLKYTGPADESGNPTALGDSASWTPMHGNDKFGYTLVDANNDIVAAAISAAQQSQNEGNDVVFSVSPSCDMQLTLENLPGDITTYYRMLDENNRNKTRYTVGFYWTEATNLNDATPLNTYAVYSHDDDFKRANIEGAHEFPRTFGANIQIPNLINKIAVQKIDDESNLINGAAFALYKVHENPDGNIYFVDRNGTSTATTIDSEYTVNSETGDIISTSGDVIVSPINKQTTATLPDGIHVGTAEFKNLDDGQYIIKEIKAPAGYKINTTNVMVLVTEDTIYANAGTENDGVGVGRGPGYVVNTLNQYASQDKIDNTLTWIYAKMRISQPSTSFSDIGDPSKIRGYITANGTSDTSPFADDAFTTYLVYNANAGGTAFNYTPNTARYPGQAIDPLKYRRIFTTSGWPYYELWQDYEYGKEQVKETTINYDDWSQDEITNLFSRSTYIRVKDDEDSTLTVHKVNADGNTSLSGASFRLYRMNSDNVTKEYYRLNEETDTVDWVTDENAATRITTVEGGKPEIGFTHLKDGTYYLEEVVAPAGYIPLSSVVTVTIDLTKTDKAVATVPNGDNTSSRALDVQSLFDDESNIYAFTVTVRNSAGHELPQTGGCGTEIYTAAGISVIVIAIALSVIKRRKAA